MVSWPTAGAKIRRIPPSLFFKSNFRSPCARTVKVGSPTGNADAAAGGKVFATAEDHTSESHVKTVGDRHAGACQ